MTELIPEPADVARLVSDLDGRAAMAARHMLSARRYTLSLLEDLSEEDWFWTPQPAVSHIAWQVGHLGFAQYGLMLFRQRGRQPQDADLMSGRFRKTFAKGTSPTADRSSYPAPGEILATLQGIHEQALRELATFGDGELDEAVDHPWSGEPTRFGALLFAGDHEMLHAGQIGLLRRLMGKEPLR
jgi:hypothetical protein